MHLRHNIHTNKNHRKNSQETIETYKTVGYVKARIHRREPVVDNNNVGIAIIENDRKSNSFIEVS